MDFSTPIMPRMAILKICTQISIKKGKKIQNRVIMLKCHVLLVIMENRGILAQSASVNWIARLLDWIGKTASTYDSQNNR